MSQLPDPDTKRLRGRVYVTGSGQAAPSRSEQSVQIWPQRRVAGSRLLQETRARMERSGADRRCCSRPCPATAARWRPKPDDGGAPWTRTAALCQGRLYPGLCPGLGLRRLCPETSGAAWPNCRDVRDPEERDPCGALSHSVSPARSHLEDETRSSNIHGNTFHGSSGAARLPVSY